jgi:hypothetical protein
MLRVSMRIHLDAIPVMGRMRIAVAKLPRNPFAPCNYLRMLSPPTAAPQIFPTIWSWRWRTGAQHENWGHFYIEVSLGASHGFQSGAKSLSYVCNVIPTSTGRSEGSQ